MTASAVPALHAGAGRVCRPPGIRRPSLPRTLVVTGHFPPRHGGVQRFTSEFVSRLPAERIAVLAPAGADTVGIDAALPFPVRRYHGRIVNNPRFLAQVAAAVRAYECASVWFTSGIPLGAAAPIARRAGAERVVVSTHGLETGWSRLPAVRQLIRQASRAADVVTVLGDHTRAPISRALGPGVSLRPLRGGVDTQRFHPDVDAGEVIARHRLADRPMIVTVGRLVPRKGQATLLGAWPTVLQRHPDAVVVLVGEGILHKPLQQLAARLGIARSVVFAGSVTDAALPSYFSAAQAYALPCRTMMGGMAIEGLGLTTLEASACGLPVLVGDSGGAGEALLPGRTGYLVDTSRHARDGGAGVLAERIIHLLDHPSEAEAMGRVGRAWVRRDWTWERMTDALVGMLAT